MKKLALALILLASPASAQMSPYGMWEDFTRDDFQPGWSTEVKPQKTYPKQLEGGSRPNISPREPDIVSFETDQVVGTIIISTKHRRLYLVLSDTEAYVYPISVGRQGFAWTGVEKVSRVQDWPDWTPPKEMLKRRPDLPEFMRGGINNPLGAKAIYLGNTLYRIHGTNDPKSIGKAESSGCIRMLNEHVLHLAQFVEVNRTIVKVY